MKKGILTMLLLSSLVLSVSCNGQSGEKETEVLLQTTAGDIRIRLFNDTPRHRDNFIKNVKAGLYDGVSFHRVIRYFMIQTGDPNTRAGHEQELAAAEADTAGLGDTISAEIVYPKYYHKRGMIGAARQGDDINPTKASDAYQFYIVTGRFQDELVLANYESQRKRLMVDTRFAEKQQEHAAELDALRKARDFDKLSDALEELQYQAQTEVDNNPPTPYTQAQKRDYRAFGGAPWLDGAYTIFGEVVEGMKVVQTIEKTKTGEGDRPLKDLRIIKASIVD